MANKTTPRIRISTNGSVIKRNSHQVTIYRVFHDRQGAKKRRMQQTLIFHGQRLSSEGLISMKWDDVSEVVMMADELVNGVQVQVDWKAWWSS